MLQNPVLNILLFQSKIDQKISQHYEEIRKLEEMKHRALSANQGRSSSQNEQSDSNPIIYHQAYSQNYQPTMQGTLINENFMPRQAPHHEQHAGEEMSESIQYPDIPMGRPLPQQQQPYYHFRQ